MEFEQGTIMANQRLDAQYSYGSILEDLEDDLFCVCLHVRRPVLIVTDAGINKQDLFVFILIFQANNTYLQSINIPNTINHFCYFPLHAYAFIF